MKKNLTKEEYEEWLENYSTEKGIKNEKTIYN